MKKILHFIKYNNLFTVVVAFVMLGSGVSLAATPAVQAGLLSSTDTVRSIDNTYLITADIANHNFNLKVTSVTEDADNYYVDYTYSTISLQDYVWKDAVLNKRLTVAKEALNGKDLGLFVADQLGQMVDSEKKYLLEAQKIEKAKGATHKIVSTQYAGLIGSMLSPDQKEFQGYTPVIAPEIDAQPTVMPTDIQPEDQRSKSLPGGTKTPEELANEALQAQRDALAQQVQDLLNSQQQQQDATTTPDTTQDTTVSTSTTIIITPPDTGSGTTPPDTGSTTPPDSGSGTTTPPATGSGSTTPPDTGSGIIPPDSGSTTPPTPPIPLTPPASSNSSQASSSADTTPPPAVNGTP